jgi:hypothetical protein
MNTFEEDLPREKQSVNFIDGLPKVWLAKTTEHTYLGKE